MTDLEELREVVRRPDGDELSLTLTPNPGTLAGARTLTEALLRLPRPLAVTVNDGGTDTILWSVRAVALDDDGAVLITIKGVKG